MKIKFSTLVIILTLCVFLASACLTVASFFGQFDWRLDLLSHFRPWYFLIYATVCLLFLGLKQWKLVSFCLLFAIINAIPLASLYLPPPPKVENGPPHFKVMQFNVCAPAKDYALLSHYLKLEKPDLVVLEECGDRCYQHLTRDHVFQNYPYIFKKTPHKHRLLVLSQFPIEAAISPNLTADPAVELLTLNIHNQSMHLLGMHSTRPSSGKPYYENQIKQFVQIGKLVATSKLPFMMIGDLNVSPWNYSFGLLLRQSKLKNSMDGFGFQPSFPVFVSRFSTFPLIPIDHVLVSHHFQVFEHHTGPRLQSDHLPIVVELTVSRNL